MAKRILTKPPPQVEIVALAVYLLGGDSRPVDTEDVAIKAHELAPGRFSWRKHPEQVNLELVRVYLSDAKKAAKGRLLSGSGRIGWSLTPAGLRWAKSAALRLLSGNLDRARQESKSGSIDERRWRRERARILATPAWSHWDSAGAAPAPNEAAEVFRIDSYADERLRTLKIARLKGLFASDETVNPFLERMAEILEEQERDQ